jgi:photosynthetic reaction center H subunit
MSAAFTQYIDVAQVVLYLFWAFLAYIIIYLHREDKREGYPLENERSAHITVQGWPAVPAPKEYLLADGSKVYAPRAEPYDARPVKATPIGPWPGAPLEPDGDPMVDGVGPASYAERLDIPDATVHGTPKLVPLRKAEGWHIEERDPDPRGMPVIAADGKQGGTVKDVWVDVAESRGRGDGQAGQHPQRAAAHHALPHLGVQKSCRSEVDHLEAVRQGAGHP